MAISEIQNITPMFEDSIKNPSSDLLSQVQAMQIQQLSSPAADSVSTSVQGGQLVFDDLYAAVAKAATTSAPAADSAETAQTPADAAKFSGLQVSSDTTSSESPGPASSDQGAPQAGAAGADATDGALPNSSVQDGSGLAATQPSAVSGPLTQEQLDSITPATVQLITPSIFVSPGTIKNGESLGSGFNMLDNNGNPVIITDGHVISIEPNSQPIVINNGPTQVTSPDASQTTADLVASDTATDLAVLQSNGPLLPSPSLYAAPEGSLSPGATVAYVGHPNGDTQVTEGSGTYVGEVPVSALNDSGIDSAQTNRDVLAIEGACPPGSSGSPVVLTQPGQDGQLGQPGQVVGVIEYGNADDTMCYATPIRDVTALLNLKDPLSGIFSPTPATSETPAPIMTADPSASVTTSTDVPPSPQDAALNQLSVPPLLAPLPLPQDTSPALPIAPLDTLPATPDFTLPITLPDSPIQDPPVAMPVDTAPTPVDISSIDPTPVVVAPVNSDPFSIMPTTSVFGGDLGGDIGSGGGDFSSMNIDFG